MGCTCNLAHQESLNDPAVSNIQFGVLVVMVNGKIRGKRGKGNCVEVQERAVLQQTARMV